MKTINPIALKKSALRQRLGVWVEIIDYVKGIYSNPYEYGCELTGYQLNLHALNFILWGACEEVLTTVHFIVAIWLTFLFPFAIGEDEGQLLCQVEGSFSAAPPDCQSCYFEACDWDEWHVDGWHLNYLSTSNY